MAYTLITGASSGLGEATARLLAQSRDLILQGRNAARLDAVAEDCSLHGHSILTFPYAFNDVANTGNDIAQFLKKKETHVDAFAHFAGFTEVLSLSKSRYSIGLDVFNVNYFAATEIISALLKKRVNGNALENILLISSIAARIGTPHQPYYCSSKGALEALCITLACDLAPKVRVNCIEPGSFRTNIWNIPLRDPISEEDWHPRTLLPPATPNAVAEVAAFLCSPQSAYITGAIIPVDGGERFQRFNGY